MSTQFEINNIISDSGNFLSALKLNGTGVSVSGHTHTSSNITDFNSSVSGLLPITNIVAGSGITVSSSSGSFTINSTSSGGGSSSIDGGIYPLISISSQPSGTTVAASSNATFSVTASASSPTSSISYQWQESTNNSVWTDISGSTSSTLTLTSVQSDKNGYYYRANLQSLLSNIYSNSAILTVTAALTPTPTSSTIPASPTPTVTPTTTVTPTPTVTPTATTTTAAPSKVFSNVTGVSNGTVSGAGTSTITLTRTVNSGALAVTFTIPSGTLTITKTTAGNITAYLTSTTDMGLPGQFLYKDGLYYAQLPNNANSASGNVPAMTAEWSATGLISDIPAGASVTLTIT